MVSESTITRLAPRLGEGTDDEKALGAGEEALGGRGGSAGAPIIGIREKKRGEPRKNGEMDWVKLPSVIPLTEQPAQCHTLNDY